MYVFFIPSFKLENYEGSRTPEFPYGIKKYNKYNYFYSMYGCMSVYVCVCVCAVCCKNIQFTFLDLNLTTQCSNCPGWPAVCVKRLHNLAEPCRVVELSLYRRKKSNFMLSEVRPLLWAPSVLLAMPPPPRLAETSAATF